MLLFGNKKDEELIDTGECIEIGKFFGEKKMQGEWRIRERIKWKNMGQNDYPCAVENENWKERGCHD